MSDERRLLLWQIASLLRFYAYNRLWLESHDPEDEEDA